MKKQINKELDDLSVISVVDSSDCGTPFEPVLKKEGTSKLCSDYEITVNKYLEDGKNPLPRIDELFAALQGGEHFGIQTKHF